MSCAVRRPLWRLRARHWLRRNGAALLSAAVEAALTLLVVAVTGLACFLLLGLGV